MSRPPQVKPNTTLVITHGAASPAHNAPPNVRLEFYNRKQRLFWVDVALSDFTAAIAGLKAAEARVSPAEFLVARKKLTKEIRKRAVDRVLKIADKQGERSEAAG